MFVDYSFGLETLKDLGGPGSRYAFNCAAINLLKRLEAEQRPADQLTTDEQSILIHYTGWGDTEVMNLLFPRGYHSYYAKMAYEMEDVITEEEKKAITASALNAHFTSIPIIDAIYCGLEPFELSDRGTLRVLEPAAGIGHFLGAMPVHLVQRAQRIAVELDSITARILGYLYPQTRIFHDGFENVSLPKDYFDLIISNVPFGNYPIADSEITHGYLKASIHDYYFVKALELAKPCAIIAFITSRYTLDKENKRIRRYIAERAELVAAARMPSGTFHANAGTDVVTDILVLRKRLKPINLDGKYLPQWVGVDKMMASNDEQVMINQMFIAQPDLMMGLPFSGRGMYRNNDFILKHDGRDVPRALGELLTRQVEQYLYDQKMQDIAPFYEVYLDDPIEHDAVDNLPQTRKPKGNRLFPDSSKLSLQNKQRAEYLTKIYLEAKSVIQLQMDDAPHVDVANAQHDLRKTYDDFVIIFGNLNANNIFKDFDRASPAPPFLRALEEQDEDGKWHPSAIFTSRTIRPIKTFAQNSSPLDAMLNCLNRVGRIDMQEISIMLNLSISDTRQALTGIVFEQPSGEYVTADEYLSGNVVEKLKEARRAAEFDEKFIHNVEALLKAQPKRLGPHEISARLGAGWIPVKIVEDFIRSMLPSFWSVRVVYIELLGVWKIENADWRVQNNVDATDRWGTQRVNAVTLIEDILNLRSAIVYDEGFGGTRVVNDIQTAAAQAKQTQIKEEFVMWLWADEERSTLLCDLYNERYNCMVQRRYNGGHLQLPGISSQITMQAHQLDSVRRILESDATLLGHAVGAGKTFAMIAAAMELKRLGIAHKSMAVVPNSLPAQWEAMARRLYPGINVLAPTREQLSAAQRGELLSRIATSEYDLIIIPHSAFKMLPVAKDTLAHCIEWEIDTLRAYLDAVPIEQQRSQSKSIKEVQKAIKRLSVKLTVAWTEAKRDSKDTVTWEELGIDALFIDEAHLYKNLYCPTKMRNVAGLPNADSQRAFDAFIKVRWLLDRGGRVVFATATPISNTLAEVYVMMKFLQYPLLEKMGIAHFDSWIQMFAETTQGLEMKPDCSGFRMNTRFNKFTNLPELSALWRQVLDVKNAEQLDLPRPTIIGGAPQVIKLPASADLKKYVESLSGRVDAIKNRLVEPDEDNMLKITTDGRKAALDIRLVNPDASRQRYSKIEAVADKVAALYQQSKNELGAQVVYCDLGTPVRRTSRRPEHVTNQAEEMSLSDIEEMNREWSQASEELITKLRDRSDPKDGNGIKLII